MKQLLKLFITTILLTSAINAKAVIITLDPEIQEIQEGEELMLAVLYDLEGQTISGGGFSINFDNLAFNFTSFDFNSGLEDDSDFRVSPVPPVNSGAFDLGFGSAASLNDTGIVGTLRFNSIQDGLFSFSVDDPVDTAVSSIFRNGGSKVGADVLVTPVSAVPLPGAIWMLMSGFAGLGLIKKSKESS